MKAFFRVVWWACVMVLVGVGGGLSGCDIPSPPSITPAERGGSFTVLPVETWSLPEGQPLVTLSGVGAWCWISDPRALYFEGQYRRTYFGYVDGAGGIRVAAWDHDTHLVSIVLLKADVQRDDHANPSLLMGPDGRLTVFWSAHHGRQLFYRTGFAPEDLSRWGGEKRLPTNTPGPYGYTYPNPLYLLKEARFYLFWRGGDWQPDFATSTNLESWSPARSLLSGSRGRPYFKLSSDGQSRIHLAYTRGHPRDEPTNSVYHVYYEAGYFWRMDGSRVAGVGEVPFDVSAGTLIFDGSASRAWIWDMALDKSGSPVIVYATFPAEHDHRYRYARWTNGAWIDVELTAAGGWFPQTRLGEVEPEPWYSGGITLDPMDPDVVYLSRPVRGIFELERWVTPDTGKSWKVETITRNSVQHNVRPVVARGPGDWRRRLLWMAGPYTYFTDYDTHIVGLGSDP